jgi:hypothetical protein
MVIGVHPLKGRPWQSALLKQELLTQQRQIGKILLWTRSQVVPTKQCRWSKRCLVYSATPWFTHELIHSNWVLTAWNYWPALFCRDYQITRPHDKFFKQVFARGDAAKEFLMKYLLPAVVWWEDHILMESRREFLRKMIAAGGMLALGRDAWSMASKSTSFSWSIFGTVIQIDNIFSTLTHGQLGISFYEHEVKTE